LAPAAVGGFGKIAAAGDFIRFGVAGDFVQAWDGWLQQEILAAREALGARWQAAYLSAPIWRFTLAPGLAGAGAALGVFMPSTDRVGRMFPLTLLRGLAADQPLAEAHFAAAHQFVALEEIALATLEEAPLEALKDACGAVAGEAAPGDPAPALAAQAVPQGAGQSLWSTHLEDGLRLLRCDGLPRGGDFVALVDSAAPVWAGGAAPAGAPA
jgi:type VI secretion system protein ImpM